MPIIEKRKITISEKHSGYKQYMITIPRNYGDSLSCIGVSEILFVLNSFGGILIPIASNTDLNKVKRQVLAVFPKIAALCEQRSGFKEKRS